MAIQAFELSFTFSVRVRLLCREGHAGSSSEWSQAVLDPRRGGYNTAVSGVGLADLCK